MGVCGCVAGVGQEGRIEQVMIGVKVVTNSKGNDLVS